MAEFVAQLFSTISQLQSNLYSLKGNLSGELKISSVNTVQPVVPYLIKTFSDLYPSVTFNVNVVNRSQALKRLEENSDDLVLMAMVPSDKSLSVLPFLDNELIPIVSADSELLTTKTISLKRFLDQPLILREKGSGSRLALEQQCFKQRLTLKSHMEFGSNDAIKHAVIAGLGVAVVPKLSVMAELKLGLIKTIPINSFPLRRSWCVVYPEGKNLTPVAQAFLDYIQQNIAVINTHFKQTSLN